MWKVLKFTIRACLLTLGAAGLIFHGLVWWVRTGDKSLPDDASITGSYPSPDNQHKAIVFIRAGGGGLSPYCSESISVIASEMEDKLAWSGDYKVFTSSCGSLGSDENIKGVKWVSAKQLSITFDINVGISRISALMLKNHTDDGQVYLTYMPRKSLIPEQ